MKYILATLTLILSFSIKAEYPPIDFNPNEIIENAKVALREVNNQLTPGIYKKIITGETRYNIQTKVNLLNELRVFHKLCKKALIQERIKAFKPVTPIIKEGEKASNISQEEQIKRKAIQVSEYKKKEVALKNVALLSRLRIRLINNTSRISFHMAVAANASYAVSHRNELKGAAEFSTGALPKQLALTEKAYHSVIKKINAKREVSKRISDREVEKLTRGLAHSLKDVKRHQTGELKLSDLPARKKEILKFEREIGPAVKEYDQQIQKSFLVIDTVAKEASGFKVKEGLAKIDSAFSEYIRSYRKRYQIHLNNLRLSSSLDFKDCHGIYRSKGCRFRAQEEVNREN